MLKISEENGILKEIIKKRITIKHLNGKETTYTPFTYAEARKNSEAVEEILKFSGELVNRRAQPTVVTAKATTHAIDKATETDTQLCEDINENSEEAQNDSTTVEPTFELCFDRETNEQETNAHDRPSSAEPCFDSDDAEEKPSTRQRQAIVAGIVGAVLLVGSVAFYALKINVTVALVVGIVGLVSVSFALYNIINPNTKFEKIESVEQPVQSSLNLT
ncbi:MAG: WD_0033/WD_0034 family tandem repeat-containing protein [Wolbachia sp.]